MKKNIKYLFLIALTTTGLVSCRNTDQSSRDSLFLGYIENTQINVTTRIPGRITVIYVNEGDTIKQGGKVAQLDVREMQANRAALLAKLRNVEVNKKRVENLYKAGAVSQQSLDEITTAYEMLSEQLRALDTNVGDMTITAPADGIVNVKVLEVNQMMAPGMPVIVETDPTGTWARFNIPETFIDQLNLGDSFVLNSNITGLNFKAKVTQILPMADFATRTPTTLRDQHDVRTFDVKMRILDQQLKCKPGMSVYLSLKPAENNIPE
ncbi:MAG: efflux RND transporter periplasmic adaptor subunit [Bacteroidales bacterium]